MKINELKAITVVSMMMLVACANPGYAGDADTAKAGSNKSFSAGLSIHDKATAEDTGLPLYPDATPDRSEDKNSDSVNVGLWGGSFGLKLVVAKFESADSPEKIAAFYRKALTTYGSVLDCSKRNTASAAADEDKKESTAKPLTCGKDKPDRGGQLFKAGTRSKQHIVAVESRGDGAAFQLIYLETRGVN
jgi:hypothetical protein